MMFIGRSKYRKRNGRTSGERNSEVGAQADMNSCAFRAGCYVGGGNQALCSLTAAQLYSLTASHLM